VSSAPHIARASDCDAALLFSRADPFVEVGIRRLAPGRTELAVATDELWFCLHGSATFRAESIGQRDVIHLKEGWKGEVRVTEPFVASYMRCDGGPPARELVLRQALEAGPLAEWGAVSTMIEGQSRTAGILLSKESPESERRAESGVWTCTPGIWRCGVSRDEFCHFIAGRSTYTHSSGEVIEIEPDTLACFPAGWNGVCEVHETVRKVYMIR
jgi:uncharacterized protein